MTGTREREKKVYTRAMEHTNIHLHTQPFFLNSSNQRNGKKTRQGKKSDPSVEKIVLIDWNTIRHNEMV